MAGFVASGWKGSAVRTRQRLAAWNATNRASVRASLNVSRGERAKQSCSFPPPSQAAAASNALLAPPAAAASKVWMPLMRCFRFASHGSAAPPLPDQVRHTGVFVILSFKSGG